MILEDTYMESIAPFNSFVFSLVLKYVLKFAQQCLRNEKLKDMFPRSQSDHAMRKRYAEKFVVTKALTERFRKSAIPNMQRLLNKNAKEKKEIYKVIDSTVPVNNDMFISSL